MSSEGIAAILVALSTFVGGVVLAVRGLTGDRAARRTSESAALLSGYTDMVKNLRAEIVAMRDQHSKDLERQAQHHRAELENVLFLHNEERARWNEERERQDEKIDLLEAQVAAALYRPPNSRGRRSDRE